MNNEEVGVFGPDNQGAMAGSVATTKAIIAA